MIRFSIRRPIAVVMAYLAVSVLGVVAWRNIPLELLPGTELPRLSVSAEWSGASTRTTEALLTSPLEAAIQQVRGVTKVSSVSSAPAGIGLAQIQVEFARGTDMAFARLELSERLAALGPELPRAATPPRLETYVPEALRTQTRPFLRYTLTGPYTPEALRAHVEAVVVPALRQVDGVGAIEVSGGRRRLLEIELQPERAQALGLSAEEVGRRVAALEIVREAGGVRDGGRERTLAIRQHTASVAELLATPLLTRAGVVVRLSDVARVHDTFEDAQGDYRIDGLPAVSFEIHREPGTNAVNVADGVKGRLSALSVAGAHPSGARLLLDDDESAAIRRQLTDLRRRAVVSALVVFLVLLAFLRSFRSAAIVFATIAFSILLALNLIYFGGLSLNVLTLMGLAMGFGLVVDNAIVVLENVYRRRSLGEPGSMAAERGSREVVLAVIASTLTTVVVLVPFVYLQGELRVYYVPLALVVGLSLLASMLVAFSFIPAMGARLLGAGSTAQTGQARRLGSDEHETPRRVSPPTWFSSRVRPRDAFAAVLRFGVRRPSVPIALAMALLAGSGWLFERYVPRGVVWRNWGWDDTYLELYIRMPRGEDLAHTDALARWFETRLRAMPEVERFVTIVAPRHAEIRITFPDSLERTPVPLEVKERLVSESYQFGGAEVRVYGFGPTFYGGGGSPPQYAIRVRGYNYERTREIAEALGRRLERFSRIRDVDTNSAGAWFEQDRASEVVVVLNRRRLALHGLTARDVTRQVSAAAAGAAGRGEARIGGQELRLAVKVAGNRQLEARQLPDVLLTARDGRAVRLGDVVSVGEREIQPSIRREDQQYQRNVSYEFRGPAKLGDRVQKAVLRATIVPPGYEVSAADPWQWSDHERRQIYAVLALSLVLIFMVTAALFESFRQPFVVLLTVPMALIGVFVTFYLTGASFTREAVVGVVMMGGIVVNNAILLVDHVNRLRREGGMVLTDAVVQGTLDRARPILMTSGTTILGLLPLVLSGENVDANIWNALGYALIGGLASSTLLVLTVTPALYALVERRRPVSS